MHVIVRYILGVVAVVRESGKPSPVEVNDERLVAGAQSVDPHVELLASDQQRVVYIFLGNVGLSLRVVRVVPEVALPLRNLINFIEQKYTYSLRLGHRLHYPKAFPIVVFLEFLAEQRVFVWKMKSLREKVKPIKVFIS